MAAHVPDPADERAAAVRRRPGAEARILGGRRRSPGELTQPVPEIYGDGCHRNYTSVKDPACVFGDPSSKTVVALFGDSHAAQWFPAMRRLAEERRWRLVVHTKSA
ncbi:SGNH hydrolase domain-containing protein [Dactylosporangium sp. NPDC005555]|uniref:SGNH hydrolase domain-containing protein n=1 Tax=Dactylosporangium sp. NPDC005555 TaxID=3154889 RepID=UPI0033ACFB97